MDFEKIVTFLPQYLSEYLSILFLTLQKPMLRFATNETSNHEKEVKQKEGKHPENIGVKLNPKLIGFAILSIFIGSTLQGITPNHPSLKEAPVLVVTVVAIWLFMSLMFFIMFRFFGGKGGFGDTISISLQLLSTIYVIASLVSFLATVLFFANDRDFQSSYFVYLITQVILLTIYLPLALKKLHFPSSKISIRLVLATIFSIMFFLVLVFFIFSSVVVTPSVIR